MTKDCFGGPPLHTYLESCEPTEKLEVGYTECHNTFHLNTAALGQPGGSTVKTLAAQSLWPECTHRASIKQELENQHHKGAWLASVHVRACALASQTF